MVAKQDNNGDTFLICQADPAELLDHAAVDEVAPGSIGTWASPNARHLRLDEPELGAITLYRLGTRAEVLGRYPNAGHLLTGKLNTALIRQHWDDLLRLAASLKFGYATASLMVAKLQAGSRQTP